MRTTDQKPVHPSMLETLPAVVVGLGTAVLWLGAYIGHARYYFSYRQLFELFSYFVLILTSITVAIWRLTTKRSRREKEWPHPPLVLSPRKDERLTRQAWEQNAVALGYNVHGEPWLWPDKVRVMQGIVLGMTGSGKTTLLRNIITQDLERMVGPPDDPHHIPMVIFDGKGDLDYFHNLLPHIHRAGRIRQLRVLNPARHRAGRQGLKYYSRRLTRLRRRRGRLASGHPQSLVRPLRFRAAVGGLLG